MAQQYEFQAEMKQLLHLIIHSLYTHPEIFLRELISNSSDALNKVRFQQLTDQNILNPDAALDIKIDVDNEKKTFSVTDTGIGMTKDDLINELGTVASSGTLEFIRQMKEKGQTMDADNIIGQFGVGFYSVFMVADEVTVETRHIDPNSQGYRWKSDGQGQFTIEEIDKPTRGTTISFTFKDDADEFASDYRIKEIIKRYSNFVDFPIQVNGENVNRVSALWHKSKDEIEEEELNEFYKFISNDYQEPLGHLHLNIEGAVNFKALVFIPKTAPMTLFKEELEKSLHLYSSRVMIAENSKELLPEYLRFARGVVDTEDLPLNVSRETVQNSPVMAKIRKTLVSKLLNLLDDWAENDVEKYNTFYQNFGTIFKLGVNSDYANQDKIVELLRFESSKLEKGKLTSFKEYVSRMAEGQKEIYYLSGDHREMIERNPNLEYFKKNDIEVLFLTDAMDVFIIPSINEYQEKPIKSIDSADIDLEKDDETKEERLNETLSKSLIDVFKETLGDRVEDVIESKRLVDSAVTLVTGKQGMDRQMEKIMKSMDQNYTVGKKILEINTGHPLIKNLSRRNMGDSTDPILRKSILHLYEGALLIDGNLLSPTEYVNRMTELMTEATK